MSAESFQLGRMSGRTFKACTIFRSSGEKLKEEHCGCAPACVGTEGGMLNGIVDWTLTSVKSCGTHKQILSRNGGLTVPLRTAFEDSSTGIG